MNAKTVELHLLQSLPPSCINRDGNNSPKDCTFGGFRRARVSSQSFKRAIRQADIFAETMDEAIGIRSKQMRDQILVPYLMDQNLTQEEAEKVADEFRGKLSQSNKKKEQETSVGLYFGRDELIRLLDAFRVDPKWKDAAGRKSADVALFGRMLAEAPDLNVDAAAQVAHAISVHKLSQEFDYWTAADDLKSGKDGQDAGAGMLGTAEFNASIFYRYACVSLPTLRANLGADELVSRTIEAFLRASFDAMPTGKINSHGNHNPPFLAFAIVRQKGMPLNLCNAFLQPIAPDLREGMDVKSANALLDHHRLAAEFAPGQVTQASLSHSLGGAIEHPTVGNYEALIQKVMSEL